jgi:hypothetical protein
MSSELLGARIRLYRDVGSDGPAIVIAPADREPILKGPTDTVSASLLLNKGCYWPAKEDQRRLSENIARGGLTLLKFETLEDALSCFSHLQERGAKLEGGPAANDLAPTTSEMILNA